MRRSLAVLLGVLFATFAAAPAASADTPFSWSAVGAPGAWSTTPIPSNVTIEPGAAPDGGLLSVEVPREIAGQAAGQAWPNFTAYTAGTFYVPLSTPLQPVKLCRNTGNCVPASSAATDDLWRALMGLPQNATPNRTTGMCATNCTWLGGGVPLTATVEGSPGTDGAAVVCLGGGDSGEPPWTLLNPDGSVFVRPDGQPMEGNCWEMWVLKQDPAYNPGLPVSITNPQYDVSWGAHRTGFFHSDQGTPNNTYGYQLDTLSGQYCPRGAAGQWRCGGLTDALAKTWFGPDVVTPGAADSTTYEVGWGVTAAELPLLTDVVQQRDCAAVQMGAQDFGHAVGIQLQRTRYIGSGLHISWWPAGNGDGASGSKLATVEGMRLFLPASVPMPAILNPAAQAVFHTIQRYGLVVDDQAGGGPAIAYNADGTYRSGGNLDIRYELGSSTDPCRALGWPDLQDIPWSALQLIKQGAESNPTPTTG